MKFFVCADVHGNVRAFDAVLAIYRREFPCEFLFLGDCVGYGSHPDACLDRVLNLPNAHLVMGNHECALLDKSERIHMNLIASEAINWTDNLIRGRYDEALRRRFKLQIKEKNFIAVHASPYKPERWFYIFNYIDADEAFYKEDFNICFIGHTHIMALFTFDHGAKMIDEGVAFKLDPGDRYIINPGSVGQPRDGDPRAACCVFDSDQRTITFYRCEYDVEAEAEDIFRAGLPRHLGDRLLSGG